MDPSQQLGIPQQQGVIEQPTAQGLGTTQPGMPPPQGVPVAVESIGAAPKIDSDEFPEQIYTNLANYRPTGFEVYGFSADDTNGRKIYFLKKICKPGSTKPACIPIPGVSDNSKRLPKLIEMVLRGGRNYTEIISINQDPTPTPYGYKIYSAIPNPNPTFNSNILNQVFINLKQFQPSQTWQNIKNVGSVLLNMVNPTTGGRRSRRYRKGRRSGRRVTKRSRGTTRFVRRRK